MQDLEKMNHKEIIALSVEQVKTLCDYECAKNGVKLIECPTEPEKKVFTPDTKVYKVADFYTESEETAQKIAIFLAEIRSSLCDVDYEYSYGSDNKYIQRNLSDYKHQVEVKTEDVFLPVTYESLKTDMRDYNEKKSAYEGLQKDYKENYEKREKETKWIHDTIYAHKQLEYKFTEWETQFAKYLKLANDDQTVALNFFRKSLTEEERGPVADYVIQRLTASFYDEKEELDLIEKATGHIISYS